MVLQLANGYYDSTIYSLLFSALANKGVESRIYVSDDNRDISSNNTNVFCAPKCNFLKRLFFFPKQNILYNDAISRSIYNNVDIIHAHTLFSSGYLAYRLYKKYNIPYIVAIRNTDVNVFFKHMPHLRHIGRKIATNAKRIIFISPAYQQQVIGKYLPIEIAHKSEVIPNGIDDFFINNCKVHLKNENTIRLIFVGKVNKNKNIETIISASNILIQRGYNVTLTLIGAIEDESYNKLITKHSYIQWFPKCSKEEILNFFQDNDIFVMPSHAETFGLVYAEAMSQGLPIIYTKGQGFDGFFQDGDIGYAVPENDADYIATKILEIYNRYEELSHTCINKVLQFNWQSIAKRYVEIYKTFLNLS